MYRCIYAHTCVCTCGICVCETVYSGDMCMYVSIYTHIYIYMYVRVYTCVRVYVHTKLNKYKQIRKYTDARSGRGAQMRPKTDSTGDGPVSDSPLTGGPSGVFLKKRVPLKRG